MTLSLTDAPLKMPASFSDGLDVQQVLAIIRRRLPIALLVGGLVFAVIAAITLAQPRVYTATVNLLLDTRQKDVVKVQEVVPTMTPDTNLADTEVEVLRSRALAEAVLQSLRLDQDPEFNPALVKPGFLDRVAAVVSPSKRPQTDLAPGDPRLRQMIVDHILANLRVSRAGLTYMINLSYNSNDPAKAALIANKFADLYIAQQLRAKSAATVGANQWLGGQLNQLKQQVESAEAAVEQYKIANNLLSSQGATLTEQQISNLDQQLASTRAEQAEREARLSTAKSQLARGSTGEDVGEALGSSVVQDLRRQRAEVARKVAELEVRYGDQYPALVEKRRELGEIDTQIKLEISRIISNLEAQAQVARERTRSVAGSVAGARDTLAGNNRASVRLRELERNAEAVRGVYETFLSRFKETSAQAGLAQSDARIVSRAKRPTAPSEPNIKMGLLLGLLVAGAAGFSAIGLAEAFDVGLSTAADVEKALGVRSVGSVPLLSSVSPRVRAPPETYVMDKPLSAFAEAFRALQTVLVASPGRDPVKVIAITSALPGEGKTTTSICLARLLALGGQKTVMVDCDLRHSSLSRSLGLESAKGLVEVLEGKASLAEVLVEDEASGASVLPVSTAPEAPKNVFMSNDIDKVLAQLRNQFDCVILDTPPVLPVADASSLTPKADTVLMLARWRRTPVKAVDAALKLLNHVKAPVAGVALTQVDLKAQAKSGYGDPSHYYAAYRKYYVQ